MKKLSYRAGKINPKALDKELEVQPSEIAHKRSLQRLNYLIGFIKENKEEIAEDYFAKLSSTFKDLTHEEFVNEEEIASKVDPELTNLLSYTNLAVANLNFFLQTLKIPTDSDWVNESFKIKEGDNLRSFLLHGYYCLSALIETMGREEAIKLHKRFISHYLIFREVEKRDYKTLEDLYAARVKTRSEPSEWAIVFGMLDDGKYFYRNDNCTWIDAIKELPDNEIKYHVCCYGDYQGAKEFYNENILLTMEHTIAEGDPYCSRVLHDTRVDWDLRHPPKEFWDNIEVQE